MRYDEEEAEEGQTCARCGMPKAQWTADHGLGLMQDGEMFCCEGCAQDTGCTCEEDRAELEEGSSEEKVEAPAPRRRTSGSGRKDSRGPRSA